MQSDKFVTDEGGHEIDLDTVSSFSKCLRNAFRNAEMKNSKRICRTCPTNFAFQTGGSLSVSKQMEKTRGATARYGDTGYHSD